MVHYVHVSILGLFVGRVYEINEDTEYTLHEHIPKGTLKSLNAHTHAETRDGH
jgi:hypothetical protein